eukprot:CAMPEP_0116844072 /NCGR_PEP_ID=MMETSP0418-20121206/12459_1 /TAXON_ID=1158023 /ORGANISM="Astrosyne radiata, Strain 13vi08-1A" /LENGTH=669 /DNA_ID=CAMNT_0004474933 /DNA_START=24 /DNA_END=2030 /DNA_ORIENTATION=-
MTREISSVERMEQGGGGRKSHGPRQEDANDDHVQPRRLREPSYYQKRVRDDDDNHHAPRTERLEIRPQSPVNIAKQRFHHARAAAAATRQEEQDGTTAQPLRSPRIKGGTTHDNDKHTQTNNSMMMIHLDSAANNATNTTTNNQDQGNAIEIAKRRYHQNRARRKGEGPKSEKTDEPPSMHKNKNPGFLEGKVGIRTGMEGPARERIANRHWEWNRKMGRTTRNEIPIRPTNNDGEQQQEELPMPGAFRVGSQDDQDSIVPWPSEDLNPSNHPPVLPPLGGALPPTTQVQSSSSLPVDEKTNDQKRKRRRMLYYPMACLILVAAVVVAAVVGILPATSNENSTMSPSSTAVPTATPNWVPLGSAILGPSESSMFGFQTVLARDVMIFATSDPTYQDDSGLIQIYAYNNSSGWIQMGKNLLGDSKGDRLGTQLQISNNGLTIAMASAMGYVRIHQWDIATGEWIQLGSRLETNNTTTTTTLALAFSGDGMYVALGSTVIRVFQYNATGGEWDLQGPILPFQTFPNNLALSDDGQYISFLNSWETGRLVMRRFRFLSNLWRTISSRNEFILTEIPFFATAYSRFADISVLAYFFEEQQGATENAARQRILVVDKTISFDEITTRLERRDASFSSFGLEYPPPIAMSGNGKRIAYITLQQQGTTSSSSSSSS